MGETLAWMAFEFSATYLYVFRYSCSEAMRKEILSSDVPLTIVPIAALTEYCFVTDPLSRASQNIAEIVMMGGSLARGNNTKYKVPNLIRMSITHAAQIVFPIRCPANNGRIRYLQVKLC